MKQKDLALVLVVVFISAVISFFVSKTIFGSPTKRQQKAEVVQSITSDFPKPDSNYFNSNSIDPTKTITIGPSNSQDPFNGSTGTQ